MISAAREPLPHRRRSETVKFTWQNIRVHITIGYYDDGRIGEVFLAASKSGETMQAIFRDVAITISLALQHGATLQTMRHALTRDGQDNPTSMVGAVVDQLLVLP